MRSIIAVTASVAMLVAQVPLVPAFGQNAPAVSQAATQNAAIAAAFKAFPSGGDPLSMRIADLITKDPKLATELVIYMRNAPGLSRAQKVAAEHGLAAAADRLGVKAQVREACPTNEKLRYIRFSDGTVRDRCCPDGTTLRYERDPDGTLRDVGCEDPWFIATSILAVAALIGIAAGLNQQTTTVVQQGSAH